MMLLEWNQNTTDDQITLEQVDAMIEDMKEKRRIYKDLSDQAAQLYKEVQAAEAKVIEALEKTERDTYISKNGTRITLSYAMSVQTPKTVDEKVAFFNWLRENKGEAVADAYMTVNSNSLNSLYNELNEEWAAKGEVLNIPGLGEPVSRKKLSVRG